MKTNLKEKPDEALTAKQRAFVELEKQRMAHPNRKDKNGRKMSRMTSFSLAGYSTKGVNPITDAYRLANSPAIAPKLQSFSALLSSTLPPEKVAKTIKNDVLQKKDGRLRVKARDQWLKATGNESPQQSQKEGIWAVLAQYYNAPNDQRNEGNQSSKNSKSDRVSSLPSPEEGSGIDG